uniref:Coiled-coil protein 142 C-terminal domain-containing protein n=2 Tax=Cyclopterus lumpus TaxID=8103 RepID=A0A8C2X0Y3_CYCLU
MGHYVYAILCAIAQTQLDSVPREVLEDILAGTDLYNQAVGEQRAQHSTTQLRTAVLQQAHYSTPDWSLPNSKGRHPAAFTVKELMMILAVHQADMAAKQLHCWASEQSCPICQVHTNPEAYACPDSSVRLVARPRSGTSALRSELTWEQLQHTYLKSSPLVSIHHQSSSSHTCHTTPPVYIHDPHLDRTIFENHHPVLAKPTCVKHRPEVSNKDQTSQYQTCISQTGLVQTNVEASDSVQPNLESLENRKLLQTSHPLQPPPSTTPHRLSAQPLSGVCQRDHSSVELLFQVLVFSNDLLAPLVSHPPPPEATPEQLLPDTGPEVLSPQEKTDVMILNAPSGNPADAVEWNTGGQSTEQSKDRHVEGAQQERAELNLTSSRSDRNPEKEETRGAQGTAVETDSLRWPHSVQWLDLGQSLLFADLLGQYRTLLWTLCSNALWLQLHVPQAGSSAGSINLQDKHRGFQMLHRMSQASKTDLVPEECRTMLEDFCLYLLVITAHAQWDYEVCRSLGSALRDKCLKAVNQSSSSGMMSVTMEHLLLLCPPLLSSLSYQPSNSRASGSPRLFPARLTLQRQTVSLVLATVQLSMVWVMSKAYQFLSSWRLNNFLLITQGDLKVLRESIEIMVHQTQSLMMDSDSNQLSTLHNHNQLLLRKQLEALDRAVSELQTFSSLVLKTFSSNCKRMSGEIFEQTMPSARHWRPSLRTGFPSSPSQYASLAVQTVIGQVLEGVAPLSDDARIQALSITMTAFMEAWMEHILKQRIKFSVQGALQLKQDFDSIRELIQSDKYGLSAELHQRLLSLRVFQQVDSAVVCLLQQPQAKPDLQSRAWEPFKRCCPANSSRDSLDAAVGNRITNLRCMEAEDLTQADASVVTADVPPLNPSSSGEPYIVSSLALGVAQREWLDLRIQSSTRRWRLSGLQCLSKSEP